MLDEDDEMYGTYGRHPTYGDACYYENSDECTTSVEPPFDYAAYNGIPSVNGESPVTVSAVDFELYNGLRRRA